MLLKKKEPKSLVTLSYGDTSTSDLENLDEINLNPVPENLDPPAIIDTNSNSLSNEDVPNDSLLSQAASSFSALPSVASSVLSTFSKRIYAGNSREATPAPAQDNSNASNLTTFDGTNTLEPATNPYLNPQIQFPGNNNQQTENTSTATQGNLNFFQTPNYESSIPEPPKLYSPTHQPAAAAAIATAAAPPPPSAAGVAQNSYRLAAKKKLYAPIPGLSGQTQPQAPLATVPSANFPQENYSTPNWSQQPPVAGSAQQEQQKTGGLFSLSNLVPSGVLQNLTDIVQTATGVKSEPKPTADFAAEPEKAVSSYYPTTAVPTNFFATATAPPQTSTAAAVPTLNLYQPTSQPFANVRAENATANADPYTSAYFSPSTTAVSAATPVPLLQAASTSTPAVTAANADPHWGSAPLPFGSPSSAAVSTAGTVPLLQTAATSQPIAPVPPQNLISSTANINFFNPIATPAATSSLPAQTTAPTQDTAPLAPPPAGAQISFRLQKGTRLYKNPLDAAETAPTYFSAQPATLQPQTIFQPTPQQFFEPQQNLQTTFNPLVNPVASSSAPPLTTSIVSSANAALPIGIKQADSQPNPIALFNPFGQPLEISNAPPQTTQLLGTTHENSLGSNETTKLPVHPLNTQQAADALNAIKLFNPFEKPLEKSRTPPQATNGSAIISTENTALHVTQSSTQQAGNTLNAVEFFNPFEKSLETSIPSPQVTPAPTKTRTSSQDSIEKSAPVDIFHSGSSQPYVQPLAEAFENIKLYKPQSENAGEPVLAPFVAQTQSQSDSLEKALQQTAAAELPQSESQTLDHATFVKPTAADSINLEEQLIEPTVEFAEPKTDSNLQETETSSFSKKVENSLPVKAEETCSTEKANSALPPPPPPTSSNPFAQKPSGNPYRKSSCDTSHEKPQLPSLASFFTPTATTAESLNDNFDLTVSGSSVNLSSSNTSNNAANFFGEINVAQPKTENNFPQATNFFNIVPSSETAPTAPQHNIPPPIGFETFTAQNIQNTSSASAETKATEETGKPFESVNNFFDAFNNSTSSTVTAAIRPSVPVGVAPGVELNDENSTENSKEEQIIQNFFNNPPPKENSSGVGDLNYDLVHSGLGVRAQHTGSLTTASNVVEPPSSICSEISELNNFAANQRLLPPQGVESYDVKNETKAQNTTENFTDSISEHYKDLPEAILLELRRMANEKAATAGPASTAYIPAVKHWFHKRLAGQKHIWTPFSHYDSALIETSLTANQATNIVSVEGGRYDVNIAERIKTPVYWEGEPIEVRRCSWFYKASDSKYVPYDEATADLLEEEYRQAAESAVWHKKILIAQNEQVVFHGPTVIVHFQQQQNVDAWGGTSQTTSRPRVVKRDLDDFPIEMGESLQADHLLLMVHGIGSACDLKLRTVEEVVDDFRSIAQQLVQSHYKNSIDMGIVGRVEVLPISWHSHLHSEEMGIDEKLKSITLESIPKLRNFTNDTLLDVLFYTSPTYCQKIVNTVASEMNKIYSKYRERHPDFNGGVSLAGHSLGSLILFDLLCHQRPIKESEEENLENPNQPFTSNQLSLGVQPSYTMGPAGTGQPSIQYGELIFHPKKFFALGSPIGMFVTIRGIDRLGLDFRLPTCPGFYNIFHPFDPVAYRIEALVNPDMSGIRPVLIPHHKGRKRMHLELKETMTRVGADLKARFLDTFKNTLESVNFMGPSARSKKEAQDSMEKDVDEVIAMQMNIDREQTNESATAMTDVSHASSNEIPATSSRSRANSNSTNQSDTDMVEIDFPLGKLNDAKRIDYVLQEAPLEFFNEYLFALSSHVCYWDSSDTILFVMKEIYSGLGISPDSQIPQQTMTIERPSSRNSVSQSILPPTL